MLVAGASGYVLKDSDGDEILRAVARAAEGGAVLSAAVTPRVIEDLTEALDRERRRTRELEAAQEALVERSVRRQELVARLSHELRTPRDRHPRGRPHARDAAHHAGTGGGAAVQARHAGAGPRGARRAVRDHRGLGDDRTGRLGRVAGAVAVDDRVRVVVDPRRPAGPSEPRGRHAGSSRSSSTTRCGSPPPTEPVEVRISHEIRGVARADRRPRDRGSIRTTTSASSVRSSSSKR